MKTYKHLYSQVCSWDNVYLAWRKARKGKRGQEPAATFEFHLEDNLIQLQRELETKTYIPGPYHSFYIHDPKRRLISAAPFRDRVVHHALCNIIEPLFERRFIFDSYANRVGKGTHRALDRCQHFARRYRYFLPLDVRQFFPSIDHALLRQTLTRVIADPDVMWLVDRILESGVGVLDDMYDMVYFPSDDPSTGSATGSGQASGQGLFAVNRPRGLPIGNLTSQFWANCFLDPVDHFIKRELRCSKPRGGFLRYVDDCLFFADDKPTLWTWREAGIEKLAHRRLTIHERQAHPRPVTEGIPFLGFVVYPTHRRLKRRKVVNYRRALRELMDVYRAGDVPAGQVSASVLGWINHARYGDTWGLRRAMLASVVL